MKKKLQDGSYRGIKVTVNFMVPLRPLYGFIRADVDKSELTQDNI